MSRTSVPLPVDRDRAYQLLEDPRAVRALVAGARRIRRFDPRWPETGSALHHSVGLPPLVVRGVTSVRECQPGRRLVLDAQVQFLGTLTVEFEFRSDGPQSVLTVTEHPAAGFFNVPGVRQLVDGATAFRNAELGRRFAKLVVKRERLAVAADRNAPRPSTGDGTRA